MLIIAIGANQPVGGSPPLRTCRLAWRQVVRLVRSEWQHDASARISPWFDTTPMPLSSQPRYVNGVGVFHLAADVQARLDPALLLAALGSIEARFGRERAQPNAPRTLDLDIVAIGDLVRGAPDPVLPHPRCHLRRFVLEPLAALEPDWRHPVFGRDVSDLLAALPDQGVRPIGPERCA